MNVKRFAPTLFILFVIICFGFICIFGIDVYADVADIEVTISNGTVFGWNDPLFPSCDTSQCVNQYSYLIITPTNPVNSTNYMGFRISPANKSQDFKCYEYGQCIFQLSNPAMIGWRGASTTVPFEFKARLTNVAPYEECDCPIPEPPEPCDDPEENSRFMQVVIDSFWKYHIAFAYAVPALLAIFIVYRIIKSRLR